MKGKSRRDNPLVAAALVGALGVDVAICILGGYWIGRLLSGRFGGNEWVVGGLLVGLAVGILSAVLIVKKVLEDTDG